MVVCTFDADRRKQKRDGRTGANHVAQSNRTVGTGCEIARPPARDIVTRNADSPHVVMEAIEGRLFKLCKTFGDEATDLRERCAQPSVQPHAQAVGHEVPAAEALRVSDEVLHGQAHGGVVCRHNRACTGSDDHVDGDGVLDELLQHADVTRATQPPAAQDETDANRRASGRAIATGSSGMISKVGVRAPLGAGRRAAGRVAMCVECHPGPDHQGHIIPIRSRG